MISVTKKFTFEAAHTLPYHEGKCKNLHGHSYRLEVSVIGPRDPQGMVIDFGNLKKAVKEAVIDKLDHSYLNDVLAFNPTAENMAEYIGTLLSRLIDNPNSGRKVEKVRLYETENSYADWRS